MVTPPRTAVVSSHVDVFSAADHSKPSTSRPVTHGGRRRPHVREEEVGAAERAMWRRELAAVQRALAESEARLQRLQAAHAAELKKVQEKVAELNTELAQLKKNE